MKVLKIDRSVNSYRVVERFAYLPKNMFLGDKTVFIFWQKYYELQLDSYWGYGWINSEYSLHSDTWNFKWSESYIKKCGEYTNKYRVYPVSSFKLFNWLNVSLHNLFNL